MCQQNRCALLLEIAFLLIAFSDAKPLRTFAGNAYFPWSHSPTQNRYTLLLEIAFLFVALSYAKPLRTFAGNALTSKNPCRREDDFHHRSLIRG